MLIRDVGAERPKCPADSGRENYRSGKEKGIDRGHRINKYLKLAGYLIALVMVTEVEIYFRPGQPSEVTEDARITGNLSPVTSRVDGVVRGIYVRDQQLVHAGQPLLDVDVGADASGRVKKLEKIARALVHPERSVRIVAVMRNLDPEADRLRSKRYARLFRNGQGGARAFDRYAAVGRTVSGRAEESLRRFRASRRAGPRSQRVADARAASLAAIARNGQRDLNPGSCARPFEVAGTDSPRAAILRAEGPDSRARISAPVSGIVVLGSADIGHRVARGDQLLMVLDARNLWVTAYFRQSQLPWIQAGCRARVRVAALGQTLWGTVAGMPRIVRVRRGPVVRVSAARRSMRSVGLFPVRIRLEPDQIRMVRLRPGMQAEVSVLPQKQRRL